MGTLYQQALLEYCSNKASRRTFCESKSVSTKSVGTLLTTRPKPALWGHLLHMHFQIIVLMNGTLYVHLQLTKSNHESYHDYKWYNIQYLVLRWEYWI